WLQCLEGHGPSGAADPQHTTRADDGVMDLPGLSLDHEIADLPEVLATAAANRPPDDLIGFQVGVLRAVTRCHTSHGVRAGPRVISAHSRGVLVDAIRIVPTAAVNGTAGWIRGTHRTILAGRGLRTRRR